MRHAIAFVIALPLAVELLGAILAIVDARRLPEARAAAVERVAVPLLCWGALWWFVGVEGWPVLVAALLLVALAHVVTHRTVRWLLQRPRSQTLSIETDADPSATLGEKRAPATMGIGKGERNLSPGR